MDENKEQADYQKGFNEGYIIAKHLPELAEQLSKVENESSRISGFQEGRKQFMLEKTKDRYPPWLTRGRFERNEIEPDKDKDREKEDIEPER